MQSFFPITYFAAIDILNGGVTIFFDVASLETSVTGDGRGRREGCIEVDLSDPGDNI